jgi:hypothetical protein
MWTDGPFACTLTTPDGDMVAEVTKDSDGTWGAYDLHRLNASKTSYCRVKGGFLSAAEAKAFVDQNISGEGWQ